MAKLIDLDGLNVFKDIILDSPEFTGTPKVDTPSLGESSTTIANTEFVHSVVDNYKNVYVSNGTLYFSYWPT